MSIVAFLIFLLVFTAGCIGSWKGALYWHNRNRGPKSEDPRDQEIRELNAALSIARKDAQKLEGSNDDHQKQLAELEDRLKKASDSLTDTQQKFNATKASYNKELEEKADLLEELAQLHRECETAKSRLTELEVQAKLSHGSNMIAGLDDVADDGDELLEAHQEIELLRNEVERWKQHCTVMSKTNKSLRAKFAELGTRDEVPEVQEPVAAHDHIEPEHRPVEASNGHDISESAFAEPSHDDEHPAETVAESTNGDGLGRDNLKSIRGVGEKLEQKLNLLGIFSFKEILELQPDDYERANLIIPNLEKRVKRDAWHDQARALHLEKYKEVI
ncbi:MAG: hypothetical protein QF790_06100 [Gammaproteobacteria bacterium]|jgi:predicted flap endonuclease-1-like 5' DNA nuclease|nr:hypothetical protein [Gammaproteobacteria bacterium]MDP6616719.1 hypothetical protein [Gammaproteobacteria bacterium]MDP6695216.1 hypothetical protein [Gammaproteobacteria bacterium]